MGLPGPNKNKLANGMPGPRKPERMPSPGIASEVAMGVNARNVSSIPASGEALNVNKYPSKTDYKESADGDFEETSSSMQGMKGVQGPRTDSKY